MVNIVIGGGIFGLPSTVAGILGGQSPIAYLIAVAGIGVIAASVAEVASRFQQPVDRICMQKPPSDVFWACRPDGSCG